MWLFTSKTVHSEVLQMARPWVSVSRCLALATLVVGLFSAGVAEAQKFPEPEVERPQVASGGVFLRLAHLSDVGPEGGALHIPRLDLGLRMRNRTGHLGFDLGFGLGAGSYRRAVDETVAYMEMGFFTDMRVYFNPSSRAQFFGLAGVGIALGGPFTHAPLAPGEEASEDECPSLLQLEGSLGVGTEIRLQRGAISFMVRMVRRRAVSELQYFSTAMNDVDNPSRTLWGMRAGVQITAYFDPEE